MRGVKCVRVHNRRGEGAAGAQEGRARVCAGAQQEGLGCVCRCQAIAGPPGGGGGGASPIHPPSRWKMNY